MIAVLKKGNMMTLHVEDTSKLKFSQQLKVPGGVIDLSVCMYVCMYVGAGPCHGISVSFLPSFLVFISLIHIFQVERVLLVGCPGQVRASLTQAHAAHGVMMSRCDS